jgi:hypothetical protein
MRRLLIVLLVLFGGLACTRRPPKFHRKEIVRITLTGERTQILSSAQRVYGGWQYRCRVVGDKLAGGGLLTRSTLQAYPAVWFREFELEPWVEE